MSDRGLELVLTDEAKEFLIAKGYNPDYGARPLRRAIENLIENPLAEELLRGTFKGKEVVHVVVEGEEDAKKFKFIASTREEYESQAALVAVGGGDGDSDSAQADGKRIRSTRVANDELRASRSAVLSYSQLVSRYSPRRPQSSLPTLTVSPGRRSRMARRRARTRSTRTTKAGTRIGRTRKVSSRTPESQGEAQLAQRGQVAGEHRAEGPGHDQAAGADDPAGVGHGPARALDHAVLSLLFDDPGHEEDVVILADGDQDHEEEEAHGPVESAPGLWTAMQRVEDQVGQAQRRQVAEHDRRDQVEADPRPA